MAEDGNNTKTALKEATGINDNRISAHAPGGLGSEINTIEFLIDGVGVVQDDNSIDPGLRFIEHKSKKDLTDEWEYGERVELGWECRDITGTTHKNRGRTFIKSFLIDGQAITLTLNDFLLVDEYEAAQSDGLANVRDYRIVLEIDGYDSVLAAIRYDSDGGYNNDSTNHDSNIQGRHEFFYDNVRSSTPEIDDVTHTQLSCTDADYEVEYDVRQIWDPENQVGTPEYHWTFDDGTTATTQNRKISHIYESPNDNASSEVTLVDADDGTEYDTFTYTYTRKETGC